MCDFISWIEKDGKVYFLSSNELNTKEGRALERYLGSHYKEDIKGHGAIRHYWGLKDGVNKECTDFSTPKNFPPEIVKAIKLGQMIDIGFNLSLLNLSGQKEYKKIEQPALAEYKKIEQSAWAEYEKIQQPAFWNIFKHKKYRAKCWK